METCGYMSIIVKYGYGQVCVYVEVIKINQSIPSITAVRFHALRSMIMPNQYTFHTVLMRHLEHNFRTKEHCFRARWRLMMYLQYLQTYVINTARFEIVIKCWIHQTSSSYK